MVLVAEALETPVSRIYGVATFYNQFRFAPLGEHVVELCRGTACHVKQSLALAQHLKRRLKLRDDGNSADGRYTVIKVACLGACSIAPVIKLDGEFYGHLTTEKLDALLDEVDARAAADARRRTTRRRPEGLSSMDHRETRRAMNHSELMTPCCPRCTHTAATPCADVDRVHRVRTGLPRGRGV